MRNEDIAIILKSFDAPDEVRVMQKGRFDGSQIKEIVEHGRLINPPPGVAPPPSKKMPAEKPPKQVVAAPDVTPPLPGALGGAPA